MSDWMTVVIILLIVGIALDGARRVRNARRASLRMSRNVELADREFGEELPERNSEFPSGGARVAARRDDSGAVDHNTSVRSSFQEARIPKSVKPVSQRIPEQVSLNLEESVPILMESIELQAASDLHTGNVDAYDFQDAIAVKSRSKTMSPADVDASPTVEADDALLSSDRAVSDSGEHIPASVCESDASTPLTDTFDDENLAPAADSNDEAVGTGGEEAPLATAMSQEIDDDHQPPDNTVDNGLAEANIVAREFAAKDGSAATPVSANIHDAAVDGREPKLGSLDDLDAVTEPVSHAHTASRSKIDVASQEVKASLAAATDNVEKKMRSLNPFAKSKKNRHTEVKATRNHEPARAEPDEVVIVNITAKPGCVFAGVDLLNALMNQGMKYGDMDIFHRHQDDNGDAPIVFSLANMVVPGTFNLAQMQTFSTPGLSLFLGLPVVIDSVQAYDDLLNTACQLAQDLEGDLKDGHRCVLTRQTIEYDRQRVQEYERKRQLQMKKAR